MIVLDTNVVSEIMQGAGSSPVLAWVIAQDADRSAITAVRVMEVFDGIARMQPGRRRDQLAEQWDLLEGQWLGTFLPMGMQAARMTGAVSARWRGMGRPMSMADACIAGICLAHEARLATRNTRDFEGIGLALIDPWAI